MSKSAGERAQLPYLGSCCLASSIRFRVSDGQTGSYQLARWVGTDKRAYVYRFNSTA
jgi:hypothetical protein